MSADIPRRGTASQTLDVITTYLVGLADQARNCKAYENAQRISRLCAFIHFKHAKPGDGDHSEWAARVRRKTHELLHADTYDEAMGNSNGLWLDGCVVIMLAGSAALAIDAALTGLLADLPVLLPPLPPLGAWDINGGVDEEWSAFCARLPRYDHWGMPS